MKNKKLFALCVIAVILVITALLIPSFKEIKRYFSAKYVADAITSEIQKDNKFKDIAIRTSEGFVFVDGNVSNLEDIETLRKIVESKRSGNCQILFKLKLIEKND